MLRMTLVVIALLILAVIVSACSPLKIVNGLTTTDTYSATVNIEYGPDARNKLDLYQPKQPPQSAQFAQASFPVVVFFFGGSWVSGDRASYRFVAEALAAKGILVIVADYRLYPQVRYPDFLNDCALAVAWAQREVSRFGGDTKRLYLMGHSSGAYNAAMLTLDPRWLTAAGVKPSAVAGWIGLAGPYDFFPMTNKQAQPVFNHPDYPPGSQPIDYVTKAAPRTFLGVPATDDVVNPERNTKQLAEKLRAAGVPVTLKVYSGASHASLIGAFAWPLRRIAPVLDDVAQFVLGEGAGSSASSTISTITN